MVSVRGESIPLAKYFEGCDPRSRELFGVVRSAIDSLGPATIRVTKSQVAFRRRRAFAWAWMPGRYLRGDVAPLVLSVDLQRHDDSARWKQIVEARPGRFTHHLELWSAREVDQDVLDWLREAWANAI